jgi:carbonic anhydrase
VDDPWLAFSDVLAANAQFAAHHVDSCLTGYAVRGLAIVTCMDSRIKPLEVVGIDEGDAKILRNAGARVTEEIIRTLVLATYLLGVERILVMPHTNCNMATGDEDEIHALIKREHGVDTRSLEFRTVTGQLMALRRDVIRLQSFPLLRPGVTIAGGIYDVGSGFSRRFTDPRSTGTVIRLPRSTETVTPRAPCDAGGRTRRQGRPVVTPGVELAAAADRL